MVRKNATKPTNSDNNGSKSMEALQEEMNDKLTSLVEEIRKLSEDLRDVKSENKKLKETVNNQADEIAELRNEINERELHARSWSVRVNNISLPPGQETDNRKVMMAVYNELVSPILAGAKEKGEIADIPSCDNLIEIAHILPGKSARKPVIVRFFSHY
jgi:predicted nuclease with TOPRIM domain